MKCPGQDRAYWSTEVVSEIPCPGCATPVEFFRDEASRRCPNCGHRFANPRTALSCAQWCAHAEQCVGPGLGTSAGGTGESTLTHRLFQWIEQALAGDPPRLARTMLVLQHAQALVAEEKSDPRMVLGCAALLESGLSAAEPDLQRIGFDPVSVEGVCSLCEAFRADAPPDSLEARIVADARRLAALSCRNPDPASQEPDPASEPFQTESGQRRAQSLFPREHRPPRADEGGGLSANQPTPPCR